MNLTTIQTRSTRAAIIVLVSTLMGGCVSGMVVRAVTWPGDPSEFWVVMRDTGREIDHANDLDRSSKRKCTVVWDGTLIENMRLSVGQGEKGDFLWCETNVDETLSASAMWLAEGAGYFDMSLPKSEREGPLVLDEKTLVERLKVPPVYATLRGARFGSSLFCNVEVNIESMSAVLNAGVNKDVHVYVGKGNRRCSFG